MLVISNEKMKLLDKQLRAPDKTWIQNQLTEMFPAVPAEELRQIIDIGFEKTANYHIDEDFSVRDFIGLMIVAAQDFDEYPPAQKQFLRPDIDPNLSVQLVCELLTPTQWQEAKKFGTRASDRDQEDYVQKNIYGILYADSVSGV